MSSARSEEPELDATFEIWIQQEFNIISNLDNNNLFPSFNSTSEQLNTSSEGMWNAPQSATDGAFFNQLNSPQPYAALIPQSKDSNELALANDPLSSTSSSALGLGQREQSPESRPQEQMHTAFRSANQKRSSDSSRSQLHVCGMNGCTKSYKRPYDLERHQKTHSGIRNHACVVRRCERAGRNGFVRRDHMLQHLRQVHGIAA